MDSRLLNNKLQIDPWVVVVFIDDCQKAVTFDAYPAVSRSVPASAKFYTYRVRQRSLSNCLFPRHHKVDQIHCLQQFLRHNPIPDARNPQQDYPK